MIRRAMVLAAALAIPLSAQAPLAQAQPAKGAKPGARKPLPPKGKPGPKAAATKPSTSAAQLPPLEEWSLDNGLKVAFLPMPKAPSVTVQVWYHVGAKDEAPDRRGSAHMFEHMMFKGTEHVRAEDHARHLSKLGGYVNAFTTEDVTAYHNTLPAEHMDFAVRLEAERMRNLWFRDEMIATEKEVVKEEIRQQENNPIYAGFLRFLEIAFTAHPYSWTAGGYLKDLDATSTDDLKAFYDKYYVPNNALLVVVGNATRKEVEASVNQWFAAIPKGEEPPRPANAKTEPEQKEARRAEVEPAQIGVMIQGYHIPSAKHPDAHALQVLALILAGGESSRLYEQTVRKNKLAVQAGGQLLLREHPGLFLVFAAYLDPSKQEALEKGINAELSRLRKGLVSAAELKKAKNQLLSQFVFGLESVTGLANQIGMSWIQRGEPAAFMADLDALTKITAQDIKRVANAYFGADKSTVVVIPPAAKGAR